MSVSEPFIRRPVATSLLTVGLLLAGVLGYRQLPVSALPQVDYPTIVVSTSLPGASAETMASAVTTPLERQFGQMPSLTQMTSVSSFGTSQITLQFDLDRNIDAAEQDVQAAINAATNLLPRTLPAPPTYSKSNPADAPILTLSVSSETMPLDQVDDVADSILAQKISQVAGVGLVTLNGGQKPAVRVQVDPAALAGTGLSLEDVRQVLVQANVNQPKGNLDGPRQDYTLATNDQLAKAASFRPLVLAYRNGAPIRLREVADVIDGVENAQLAGWANASASIILNVQRQPGANVIEVADRVKALLPQLRAGPPPRLDVQILTDRTETVRASVDDVQFTLLLTIVLVVAVIYVFLRSLRATIIPGVAVPLSLVGTFGVMYLLRLQPEQPVADGAHHLDGLRRRRRHRHDREHRALRRGGRAALRGGAQGREADRLHDRLAHRLARGGAHPAALHGRHHRPALPRVRGHARDRHRRVGGALAHAHRR